MAGDPPPAIGVLLLSAAVTGSGASILAGTPLLLAGHLSLAWADVAVVLMGYQAAAAGWSGTYANRNAIRAIKILLMAVIIQSFSHLFLKRFSV